MMPLMMLLLLLLMAGTPTAHGYVVDFYPSSYRLLWLQRTAISSSSTTVAATATTTITSITTQAMILDGGEWNSLQQNQQQQQRGRSSGSRSTTTTSIDGVGRVVAVVGTLNSQRVVGLLQSTSITTNSLDEKGIIQLDDPVTSPTTTSTIAPGQTCMVEPKSIAYIPNDISNEQAIWTALFCISRVYALWPTTTPGPFNYQDDGNGTTTSPTTATSSSRNELLLLPHPNIWIIGGNDDAVTTMNILTTLGANVTMIAKNRPKTLPGNFYSAENDIPFADGLFTPVDGILDVLGDEGSTMIGTTLLPGEPWKCQNYVSLKTHSLSLIETNGLFTGPGKVQQYTKRIIATAASNTPSPTTTNNKSQNQNPATTTKNVNYAPPIGKLLDRMLNAKCLFTKPKDLKDSVYYYVRTWELADFWESTTWPRQFMSNVRYGWPSTITMNDEDDDELYENTNDETPDGTKPSTKMMISAPPSIRGNPFVQTNMEEFDDEYDNENDSKESSSFSSPDVTWITDSLAVDTIITQPRKTAIVFVSAPFCRTCRYLKPLYQRMAKQYKDCHQQQKHSDRSVVEFCQADASGPVGKILSRKLGIDAVPSFLFFRQGKRFGPPLSVSRIPSPKLDLAISWILDENAVWDDGAIRAMDENEKRRKMII